MSKAIELGDVAGYAKRKAASEAKGLKRGIGYSAYIEACGIAPSSVAGALGARAGLFEAGEVRVHPTGKVTVFTGSHSHGQGHETTFAQVVADKLGIGMDDVVIEHGDTGKVLFGMGTYGSRSIAVGGTAIVKALDKVIAKGKKIAAHLMEAADTDVVFEGGAFKVAGTDKNVPFAQVALTAYVPHNFPHDKLEPGLNENAFYDPSNFTYPAGTYICEVEVDPATGAVKIDRFTACDDFGNVVNPMIVEGQVHGGLAQGLGQALLEHGVYDENSGQLLSGSFMDYAMPRADDFPTFAVETVKGTPCTHNPLGVKGCGEAGAIGSPPALINAICDALGVKDMPMPASPVQRVEGGAVRQPLNNEGELNMQAFNYAKPVVGGRRGTRRGRRRCQAARRRAVAAGSDEARPRGAGGAGRPGRHRRAARHHRVGRHGRDRRHDHACRGGGVEGRAAGDPGARGLGRQHRRPPGAQPRHHRRQPGQQRPGRRLSRRGAGPWARRSTTDRRTIAADDFFKGLYETALNEGEIITAVSFPVPREGGLAEVQAAGVALRAGRRVRRQGREGVRVAVTGAGPRRVPRQALEQKLTGELVGAAPATASRSTRTSLNSDLHGSAEYRAALIPVLAKRAVG